MPKGGIRPLCSIEGCGKPHCARGMCRTHWERIWYSKTRARRRVLKTESYKRVTRWKRTPEAGANQRLRKWFGILPPSKGGPPDYAGIAEYERRLAEQNGGCALCKRAPKPGKRHHVDHNHRTGALRGLLCGPCNGKLLGRLERFGHMVTLPMLIEYLKKYDPENRLLLEKPVEK